MAKQDAGYSLIEVLIAIAITAVVLLTVVTMFYMGRRNVYSGKQMTVAASVGTRILEDLSTMTAQDLQTHFGLVDSPNPLVTVTLERVAAVDTAPTTTTGVYGTAAGEESFPGSIARDTSGCTATMSGTTQTITCVDPTGAVKDYDHDSYLAKWYGMIVPGSDASAVLSDPVVGLIITPRNPTNIVSGKTGSYPVTTAQFYKIRAYVTWKESKSGTRRYAFFDTTRVNRGPF